MALQIGDTLDSKYRIVRLLGEGGMGAVFEGENTRIHRRVAIKVLHAGVATSADAVQRFEREAQAAGRIGSEHIVEVLDLGNLPDGERYMVMEYLEGESLADRITKRGRISPQVTVGFVIDILEGLRAAHDAGIIHRDLKPDNVFLLASRSGKKDFVKLVDFGISKFNVVGNEFSMTRTGSVMGTPYYMAPEQAKGHRAVDHRADLYSIGVILYETVCGEVPFSAETFNELLFKIVLEEAPPLEQRVPGIDQDFVNIVVKSMARDPAQRFQDAAEFQTALRAWLSGQPQTIDITAVRGTPAAFDARLMPGGANPDAVHTVQRGPTMSGGTGVVSGAPLTDTSGVGYSTPGMGPRTQGNWAQTGGYGEGGNNSKKILLAAAAVLLLAAGGGAYAFKSSTSAAETARLAAQAEADEREQEQKREVARLEAENAKAIEEREKAEAARLAAEKARAEAEAAEHKRDLAEAARPSGPPPGGKKPGTPTPANPAASDPKPAQPSGRIIRTDL